MGGTCAFIIALICLPPDALITLAELGLMKWAETVSHVAGHECIQVSVYSVLVVLITGSYGDDYSALHLAHSPLHPTATLCCSDSQAMTPL